MRTKKDWKYYLKFYIMIVVVYFIYVSILAIREGGYEPYALLTIVYLPPLFVGFVVVFDRLLDPLFRRLKGRNQKTNDDYDVFLQQITILVQDELELSLEDFRRLRENDRFQKALKQAHHILQEGESNDINYTLLDKKFKKNSKEYLALQVVTKEVQKNRENQWKDYQK